MKISTQKQKTRNAFNMKNIGIFSASLLAATAGFCAFSPVIRVNAETDFDLDVNEVMSLRLDKNELNLSSAINGFVQSKLAVVVSTNSLYGYSLTIEDVDNNTNMVHANSNINEVVSSDFDGIKTSSEMGDNTWGFSLNETDFSKIPVNGSPSVIKQKYEPMKTASESVSVDFGIKVGNIASGSYSDSVLFSVYSNGQEIPNNPPMQDFDCTALAEDKSTYIRDSRDGNVYRISKFEDGRCWMTENLRIHGITITSADSDISGSFDIPDHNWTHLTGSTASTIARRDPYVYDRAQAWNTSESNYRGLHYNYVVATAGTNVGLNHDEATQSICPKGWKMPSAAEYQSLLNAYSIEFDDPAGADTLHALPFNYDYPGTQALYSSLGSPSSRPDGYDLYGHWWSTTPSPNATSGYNETFFVAEGTGVELGMVPTSDLLPVRCINRI